MALQQRARNDEDKQARAEAILCEAGGLLADHPYAKITMAQVAASCGLAKGTLYLYFRSKEELFLALLERELVAWFDGLDTLLSEGPGGSPEGFGARLAESLAERRTLGQLLVILHSVLEHNVDPARALAFKRVVRARLARGGAALEAHVPSIPTGTGARLLRRIHALAIGLLQMEALRLDFEHDLAASVATLVRGTAG